MGWALYVMTAALGTRQGDQPSVLQHAQPAARALTTVFPADCVRHAKRAKEAMDSTRAECVWIVCVANIRLTPATTNVTIVMPGNTR